MEDLELAHGYVENTALTSVMEREVTRCTSEMVLFLYRSDDGDTVEYTPVVGGS